jgi:hypothetical protein
MADETTKKRPSMKRYAIILIVLIVVIGGYFAFTHMPAGSHPGDPVRNSSQAKTVATDVGKSVSDISSQLDDITNMLGG